MKFNYQFLDLSGRNWPVEVSVFPLTAGGEAIGEQGLMELKRGRGHVGRHILERSSREKLEQSHQPGTK